MQNELSESSEPKRMPPDLEVRGALYRRSESNRGASTDHTISQPAPLDNFDLVKKSLPERSAPDFSYVIDSR